MNANYVDAQAGEVSDSLTQEVAGGDRLFVGEHGGEGDAGVVVDGDVEELPACARVCLGLPVKVMAGVDEVAG